MIALLNEATNNSYRDSPNLGSMSLTMTQIYHALICLEEGQLCSLESL